jgi:adenylate cyclase
MDLVAELSRPPKVLIADDDWLNRDLLQTYLSNAGCEVIATSDGEQAWDAAQEQLPDLALLDIRMPRLDGLSLCKRLKQDPKTRFMPVVIVTALDAEEEELNAVEVGADDFINKPYNSLILLTRVRSLLRLKRMSDELESRNQLLRQVLNRYVDQDVADVILEDPEQHLKLGGETRAVTVLFADLSGFTRFTEKHPARQVVEMLNQVFARLTGAVFQNGGTFDKFLGDAIMAFYGAPVSGPDDARRAARSALEMQRCFVELLANPEYASMAPMGLRVGLHSGDAIVGNIGTERVMDYTVVGDTVNVARRLQEAAQPGEILVSEAVCQQISGALVRRLTPQSLPGRRDPVLVYALTGLPEMDFHL